MKAFAIALAVLIGDAPAASAQPPTRAALSEGEHHLDVGGVRLWYRVAGRGAGIPIIFLHGGPGQGSQSFQAVGGPQLERTQQVVYFDQRGAGRSERPRDPSYYSLDILVEDIEKLRRHLGTPQVVLLGHSFGTILALEYAARYPAHTAALVLAAATPHLARSLDLQCQRLETEDPEAYARSIAGVRDGALPRCNTMRAYNGEAAKAFAVRNLFPDPSVARRVEMLDSANGLRNSGEVASALFAKGLLQYRFTRTAHVQAPVLVISGGRDYQAAIEPQRELVRELPNGQLLEYPENGHFMFVEDPVRFAEDVTTFLRRIVSDTPKRLRAAEESLQLDEGDALKSHHPTDSTGA